MAHWTIDDIPWDRFQAGRVTPAVLHVVKAAALVERNAADYAAYLSNVFADDPAFPGIAERWAREEVQHGEALGRWTELADGGHDFAASFHKFAEGYHVPIDLTHSVRGSRTGELVARCMVEIGTSSFYSALHDATDEPVLRDLCGRIAADEFRHYKLFYNTMQRHAARDGISRWRRLAVMVGRLREADDDELAFAYHCGNDGDQAYEHARCNRLYRREAFPLYRREHIERAVAMMLKAAGFNPQGRLAHAATGLLWWSIRAKAAG